MNRQVQPGTCYIRKLILTTLFKQYNYMYINCRITCLLFVSLISLLAGAQQDNPSYSKETEEKIKAVENGLSGWSVIQDSSMGWNIMNRMKTYNIHGVSVAVVQDYKIVWARGY